MDCSRGRDLLGAHVLGRLEPEDAALVQDHLAVCPACAAEAERLAVLRPLLDLAGDEVPASAPARLEQAVLDRYARDAARPPARVRRGRRWLAPALATGAAAALAAGLFLGSGVLRSEAGWEYSLRGRGPASEAWGEARIAPSEQGTSIHLRTWGLPDPGRGVYEMWFRDGRRYLSGGTFRVDRDGKADVQLTAAASPREFRSMGVTLEPDAADPARNGVAVLAGRIRPG
jgi:hypothetical protein